MKMGIAEGLQELDGLGQAQLVRRKEVQPIELIDAAIARIERLNPVINAVVSPVFEQARQAARNTENLPDGPFRGVPYLVKDLVASLANVPLTCGSAFLRDYVPKGDSELVRRLRQAGLIIVGKTNTPEFGLMCTTEPKIFGPARNPWNTELTTGGSSGGSCAAVASGMVAMAHANDGGGSIRMPASCCGVFGLKPTRGRVSLAPDHGEALSGLVVEHAVTRSVRDSAALLDVTAGPAPGDPYWAAQPSRPFLQEAAANPGRLRIALLKNSSIGTPVHPDCVRAVEDAARLCEELGHEVTEDTPKMSGEAVYQAFMTVWAAGCAATIDRWAMITRQTPRQEQFEPLTWSLYEIGSKITASVCLLAEEALHSVSRQVAQFMIDYDLMLSPTLGMPPVPLGYFSSPPLDPLQTQQRMAAFAAFAALWNATGQPAMSVPLCWNAEDLPIGVQFAARYGDEATLFRLAGQLESARPWAGRWPASAAAR
jgi:amidase